MIREAHSKKNQYKYQQSIPVYKSFRNVEHFWNDVWGFLTWHLTLSLHTCFIVGLWQYWFNSRPFKFHFLQDCLFLELWIQITSCYCLHLSIHGNAKISILLVYIHFTQIKYASSVTTNIFVANSIQGHGWNGRKIGHSLHSLLRLHNVAFYDNWIVFIILDWIWDMCCENLNAITRSGLLKVEGIGTELAVQSTRLNKAL